MSVQSGRENFYYYWLVPVNLTGIPGPKSDPRAMFWQQGIFTRFRFIPRWNANVVPVLAGGPPQVPNEALFGALQRYEPDRAGIPQAHIIIEGEVPSQATHKVHPQIFKAELQAAGSLSGQRTYWFMLAVFNTSGFSQVSLPFAVPIEDVGDQFSIRLTGLVFPPDPEGDPWTGYRLYCHTQLELICEQLTGGAPLPVDIPFTGPLVSGSRGIPTDVDTRVYTRAKVRIAWHSGVAGCRIWDVGTNTITSADLITSLSPTDDWTGRDCSVLGPAAVDSPDFLLQDFHIDGFDGTTGTLTVTPDPLASGVTVDMALVMRTAPDIVTTDSVGDSMFVNQVSIASNPPNGGMAPEQELDRLVYLYRGTGAGQIRQIVSATPTTLTVSRPWDVQPDATTWFLVMAASFIGTAPDSNFTNLSPSPQTQRIDITIPNIRNLMMLVEGYLVLDDQETPEEWTQKREIYVLAQPPGVRIIGPAADDGGVPWTLTVDDQTIIADTTDNDILITIPPLIVYQGRGALIYNQGPHSTIIETTPPDVFSDGTFQLVITEAGGTRRITAAGIY